MLNSPYANFSIAREGFFMEKFSKETPGYSSNNVFARLSEPRLSLSRAANYRNSTAQLCRPAKNIIPQRLGVLY